MLFDDGMTGLDGDVDDVDNVSDDGCDNVLDVDSNDDVVVSDDDV